jgi:hypothetical protein
MRIDNAKFLGNRRLKIMKWCQRMLYSVISSDSHVQTLQESGVGIQIFMFNVTCYMKVIEVELSCAVVGYVEPVFRAVG